MPSRNGGKRIETLITRADTVVFVISPDARGRLPEGRAGGAGESVGAMMGALLELLSMRAIGPIW
jgi:hypothetical protein